VLSPAKQPVIIVETHHSRGVDHARKLDTTESATSAG